MLAFYPIFFYFHLLQRFAIFFVGVKLPTHSKYLLYLVLLTIMESIALQLLL